MAFIVPEEIEAYARARSEGFSDLMQELVAVTHEKTELPQMLSGALGGGLLRMVARLIGARRALEVGMFTGFSALCMAEGMPEDGEIITCEIDEHHAEIARSFFARSPHGKKIEVRLGPALETLAALEGPFDMAFIDADKTNYPRYYERVFELLRPGGVLLVDNALWSGSVLEPEAESARAIDQVNRRIETDERVENLLLTVRDGVHLVRKK